MSNWNIVQPEFTGTLVGIAMFGALNAWNARLPVISKELIRVIERDGNVSADLLQELVDEAKNAFGTKLYEELKRQGVEVT